MHRSTSRIAVSGGFVCAVLIASFAPGCSRDSRVCTTIGCTPGIQVEIVDPEWKAAPEVDIAVTVNGRTIRKRNCSHTPREEQDHGTTVRMRGGACMVWIPDEGGQADELTITARWAGGRKTERFRPEYRMVYPNGPDCAGQCEQAAVRLEL